MTVIDVLRIGDLELVNILDTFITITRADLKSVGFADGSRIAEDDWKDRKRPAILRESAKLFRNKT